MARARPLNAAAPVALEWRGQMFHIEARLDAAGRVLSIGEVGIDAARPDPVAGPAHDVAIALDMFDRYFAERAPSDPAYAVGLADLAEILRPYKTDTAFRHLVRALARTERETMAAARAALFEETGL
ncbi:hypothetical protein [Maricaulis sp.]|uniref:hypothetical protein n=1 Tax=Maricaulis sp. TaxID=1486257 RepID=UPI003A94D8F5